MNIADKARLLAHIARWRLTWSRRDQNYLPKGLPSGKFINANQAAERFSDSKTVLSTGMAANGRCSIFYWALRERFEKTGHPRDLTWITVGAQGSRGRVPGTLEELDFPGLITRYIGGHVETCKAQLRLADQGHLELHAMPQGEQAFLIEGQGKGTYEVQTTTGIGTFLDPRVGNGTAVSPGATDNFVRLSDNGESLVYHLPKIEIGILSAPWADREGNIYFHNASSLTECYDTAMAAHSNGGLVMAAVGGIIPKDESRISIPAEYVDHIVVNPGNEQTGSIPQSRYWPMFTPEGNVDIDHAVDQLRFVNGVLKITPVRDAVDNALARMAASLFTKEAKPGATINIGVGLPEEVSRLLYESGLFKDLNFTTETGVYGGLPTPGIFFGAAINPNRMESSSWMFHLYEKELDIAVLGFLQVDSEGNVNVSKRGPRMLDYVGPGGFPDIIAGASTVLFVGKWSADGKMAIQNGQLVFEKRGKSKFVEQVDQITFSGKQGLKAGKRIYYVTNVGIFTLTERGLELIKVAPGVDIQRDILDACPTKITVAEDVEIIANDLMTGEGFRLSWQ